MSQTLLEFYCVQCSPKNEEGKNLELSISIVTASAISEYMEWLISEWKTKFASARLLIGSFYKEHPYERLRLGSDFRGLQVLLLANYPVNRILSTMKGVNMPWTCNSLLTALSPQHLL
jgi:hypothetical protein